MCAQHGVIVTILEPEAVRTYLRGGVTEDVLYCETCNEFGRHHTTIGLEIKDVSVQHFCFTISTLVLVFILSKSSVRMYSL